MKSWHMLACAGLIALGAILLATGAGALAILGPLACVAMMGAMAWMMIRSGGS